MSVAYLEAEDGWYLVHCSTRLSFGMMVRTKSQRSVAYLQAGWLVSHIVLAQLATEGSLAKLRAEFRTGDEGWQISKDKQRDMLDYRCVLYTKVNDPIPQVSPHVYWSYLLTLPLMIVNGKPFLI